MLVLLWAPWGGPYGAPWGGPKAPGQGRWAKADGPGPMGLEDPPVGVYSRARGRWASRIPPWGYISGPEADGAPWAPWASGTPPMYNSIYTKNGTTKTPR